MKHETLKSYILGFVLSLALTIAAFVLVMNHLLEGQNLILVIVALALIQLWVQLIFFIHLDQERGARWNLAMFLGTIGLVLILVIGSLVIMHNLNRYHISPADTGDYIIHDEGIKR